MDLKEFQKVETRIVLVFVVEKRLRKIYSSSKDTVVKALTSLGVKPKRIIKGKGFCTWDIQLPSLED